MMKYSKADVSEQQLEGLVRRDTSLIEKGLLYVDHQKQTAGGRLDVLMVDSGKSLVIAELKVTEEDGMLLQGLDYYDYVSTNKESFARLYKTPTIEIDPTQPVRLFLIAPSFSQTLVNRCKWLNLPIFLFTFSCLKFEGEDEIVPIFTDQQITPQPAIVEVPQIPVHLNYITDTAVRAKVTALLEEIKNWNPGNISVDPIKDSLSLKVNNRVFCYLYPRRQHFLIGMYDPDDEWKAHPVKSDDDLATVKPILKATMERRMT